MPAQPLTHFEDLFAIDEEARRRSAGLVEELAPA
jgi:hypothetical protein